MKIWLDDERPMPPGFDVHVKTAQEAIHLLSQGKVTAISLDHDLGPPDAGNGAQVAMWIEEKAFHNELKPLKWAVHSANPVGRTNMIAALQNADRFWSQFQEQYHRIGAGGGKVYGKEGAGIFYTNGKKVLLLKRSSIGDNPGTWCLPGGRLKSSESAIDGAKRETAEECGDFHPGEQFYKIEDKNGLQKFTVFFFYTKNLFSCRLSKEHTDWRWFDLHHLQSVELHPKFKDRLKDYIRIVERSQLSFKEWLTS